MQAGAQGLGLQLEMFNASTPGEIDAAFAAIAQRKHDALLVGSDPFFLNLREDLVARVARLRIPTIYPFREYAAAGDCLFMVAIFLSCSTVRRIILINF